MSLENTSDSSQLRKDILIFDQLAAALQKSLDGVHADINKQLAAGKSETELASRINFRRTAQRFLDAAQELNRRHTKKVVLINGFVEGIRANILAEDDRLPLEVSKDSSEMFSILFSALAEDYERNSKDYFQGDKE